MTSNMPSGPIVLESGSSVTRAGFSGHDAPQCTIPSAVGHACYTTAHEFGRLDRCCGALMDKHRKKLRVRAVVERGVVVNWDCLEKIWHHCVYKELQVVPEEHNILLVEAPQTPPRDREKTTQIMFETFEAPRMYIGVDAVMSLHASGRTTGIVLDVGDGVSHAVPVYEGHALPHAITRSYVGGRDIAAYLKNLLTSECHFEVRGDHHEASETMRDIKERLCYVALDFNKEMDKEESFQEFELPDGECITIGNQRFRCLEALFNAGIAELSDENVSALVFKAIQATDSDLHHELYANLVLAGGSTLFQGFPERLAKDIVCTLRRHRCKKDTPSAIRRLHVVAPPDRKQSAWIGGSIVAQLSSFQNKWITTAEYDENGPTIVHMRCY